MSDEPKIPRAAAQATHKVHVVIGHRGSCIDRPENTLTICRRVIEAGASVVAIDGGPVAMPPDTCRTSFVQDAPDEVLRLHDGKTMPHSAPLT